MDEGEKAKQIGLNNKKKAKREKKEYSEIIHEKQESRTQSLFTRLLLCRQHKCATHQKLLARVISIVLYPAILWHHPLVSPFSSTPFPTLLVYFSHFLTLAILFRRPSVFRVLNITGKRGP